MVSLSGELLSSRAEMHSAQDGILAAILLSVAAINVEVATVLFGILGVSVALSNGSLKLKKFVKVLDEHLLRVAEIRANPEYFVIPFVATVAVILGPAYYLGYVDPSVWVV